MYRITLVGDGDIAVVDAPVYIKIGNSGAFCPAKTPEDAVGVAVDGTPYNLFGHNEIEGAGTVMVQEVDAGIYINKTLVNTAAIDDILMKLLEG